MKIFAILILALVLHGCSKPREHDELREMISQIVEFEVTGNIEVVEFESETAIGDYVETYRFKFTDDTFGKIEQVANESVGWEVLKDSKILQRFAPFEGHGFNLSIAIIDRSSKELRVQFIWE